VAALIRWNPWSDVVFGAASCAPISSTRHTSNLAIDIRQNEDAYVIEASVPGFTLENIDVTVEHDVLTIKGSLDEQSEQERGGYLHRERRKSSVYRQVALPAEARLDEITAGFERGVLTVTIPRSKKPEPRRIPINDGGSNDSTVIDVPAKS
jgi:HSP20 family protein